uniref:ankyrin repeat-containing protein ITN1-like n=1 Tax=Erigeron canadensis TaxID=72917 RepID=UPI001CB88B0F|nr:ankyrin repeat-containing protein ITN1-like [Erigeron canadensis]
MATSYSNNKSFIVEVGEEYPYPSHVIAPHFVTVKLSGNDKYDVWKTQLLCLLRSHGMLGFIDGTIVRPHDDQNSSKRKFVKDRKKAWMRSDSLVTGWILGSLSEEVAMEVVNSLTSKHNNNTDFTAKDAWDELQHRYAPSITVNSPTGITAVDKEEEEETNTQVTEAPTDKSSKKPEDDVLKLLLFLVRIGASGAVRYFIDNDKVKLMEKITINGDTVLHVAVCFSTANHEILRYLLSKIPEEKSLSDLVNSDGSTLLHVAAIVGNTEAAKILLEKSTDLLLVEDKDGHTPLALSLSNIHPNTSRCLIDEIKNDNNKKNQLFSGKTGDDLLVLAISSKKFGLAKDLLTHYETIHSEAVLMAIAQYFPCELKFWGGIRVWPFIKRRVGVLNDASDLLRKVCQKIPPDCSDHYYLNPIFEATRQNAFEVVEQIVSHFPNAIKGTNEDDHDFIQYAVINRSEAVYNMLFQMSADTNIDKKHYKTIKDNSDNNLLHLAANLAPSNKLNLISGAALQIQRELQWFKEVEEFVNPIIRIQKNSSGKTPQKVFTEAHRDLVIEGEKWMKETAQSYTITAALITTIVFAAAITVPGGDNQDIGIPIFRNNNAFTVFAVSDAISLFAAVTSLLMFLSILTARFPQEDFLIKLPKRLIIGLLALFISTTTMIVAFGATLYLVFGQGDSRILIIICVLTSFPITLFVRLQFPLIADLVSATYGPSIFVKYSSFSYFF